MTELPFSHALKKQLSDFSTFGIGGPARYFAKCYEIHQMQEMLSFAYKTGLAVHILGKGSNTLFDDKGFNGLVILNRINYLKQNNAQFTVGSGYSFARLGALTARKGWEGLEFASAIPATVGGAIYMNAGANGKQTADALQEVGYVTEKGELIRLTKQMLQFDYRHSCFQKRKGAIVEAIFSLSASESVKQRQKEIVEYRLKTQPYGQKSAGCAFCNPEGDSAGRMIENLGLKGMERGGASICSLHGNFIINKGNATAKDVLTLIDAVKQKVLREKGILLEEEIRYIPYEL